MTKNLFPTIFFIPGAIATSPRKKNSDPLLNERCAHESAWVRNSSRAPLQHPGPSVRTPARGQMLELPGALLDPRAELGAAPRLSTGLAAQSV